MARTSKVELNLAKLNEVQQAIAVGCQNFLEAVAREASARAHDHPATEGRPDLKNSWGGAVYVDGKKVGNVSADGSAVAKPRAFRAGKGLSGVVGFGFPARFEETGTSDTPAHPFFTPALMSVQGRAIEIIRDGAAPLLKRP